MSVWLFGDLKLEDPKVETERFIILLRDSLTCFGSSLYFPMIYFEQQAKIRRECEQYRQKFDELRDEIFAVRDIVRDCKNVNSLAGIAHDSYCRLQSVYDNLLFVLAAMPEQDKWIGSCNIRKSVSGVMSSDLNETLQLLYILKNLEANCK